MSASRTARLGNGPYRRRSASATAASNGNPNKARNTVPVDGVTSAQR